MIRITTIYLILLLTGPSIISNLNAQSDTVGKIKYTPDFKFKDGIFIDFNMVRSNNPIPRARIITNDSEEDNVFYEKLVDQKELSFYDENGIKQDVKTEKIWGYSYQGNLFIKVNESYEQITIIGGICHFVANVVVYSSRYNDPFMYSNPYYYGYGMRAPGSASNEMRQFILDFRTGKTYEYTSDNIALIMMRDPELHDEYAQLKRRKQQQLKFFYIRKFNERNPLYFPE